MEVKKGVQTSEFWTTVVTGIITVAGSSLGVPQNVIGWLIGLAGAYLTSRTAQKMVAIRTNGK
jgi:hypothetical protein